MGFTIQWFRLEPAYYV